MKKVLFLTFVLLFIFSDIKGQFLDNLESYSDGEIVCNGIWGNASSENCLLASSDQARTGTISGYITNDGSSKTVLDLGNKIFGTWSLQFYEYIPTGSEALCYIQGAMEESAVGNIYFNKDGANPGIGFLDWGTPDISDDTYFNFPHDTWFWLVMNFDISLGIAASTWEFGVDGVVVVPAGSPFADGNGNRPTSLGSVVFVSSSTISEFYFDDFCYDEGWICSIPEPEPEHLCFPLSDNEISIAQYSIYPNPVDDILYIDTSLTIKSIKLYSILGELILENNTDFESIDCSNLKPNTYILEIESEKGVISKKVMKI